MIVTDIVKVLYKIHVDINAKSISYYYSRGILG
jgi:hypothetical protein